ncbi:hypothetical protein P3746_20415 [Vibrio parahaemolyticus]|nr:hypothetical protein [Vibrio parahaemolyticus]
MKAINVERDKNGMWVHPELPEWGENTSTEQAEAWFVSQGLTHHLVLMDGELGERWGNGELESCAEWEPASQIQDSFLVGIWDTEDGVVAMFASPLAVEVTLRQVAAALREVRKGSDRAFQEDGEVLGYWQTPEFIEYLLELADECDRVAIRKEVAAKEIKSFTDKEALLSAFGDGWFEGFIKARQLARKGEDLEDYDVLLMSEDEEQIAKVGVRNTALVHRVKELEATLLTVRSERDIYKSRSEQLESYLGEQKS